MTHPMNTIPTPLAMDKSLLEYKGQFTSEVKIQMLDLLRPIYQKTAAYGHFGRDEPEFSWERTDKAAALGAPAGL